jgi:L-threonylcarbamoyladenylate synthase
LSNIDAGIAALKRGELVVIPTDTVYGVAALPSIDGAAQRLIWVKGRPSDKAIPILGNTLADLEQIASFDARARSIAERFWPGALTLVLPRAKGFDTDLGGSDGETVAVRVPDHDVSRDLLGRTGPLAVTSANRSGEPAATSIEEARAALGDRVTVYLDGGTAGGSGSTVVSLISEEPVCLREGDLPFDAIT